MIVVQGEARFHLDDMAMIRAAAAPMIAATRAEPGCLTYGYAEDLLEPGLVRVTERWADQAALETHFAAPHMAAFLEALGRARVLALKILAFDATGERVIMGG